jgi:hypothetical protein
MAARGYLRLFRAGLACPCFPTNKAYGRERCQEASGPGPQRSPLCLFFLQIGRKREPTSGLEPLTCSLRVITQALQGLAGVCKSCIDKPVPLLCLAPCCTVLRSRWYQSGIKSTRTMCRQFLCNPDPRSGRSLLSSCAVKDRKIPAATWCPDGVSRLYCAWITRFPSPYSALEERPG